MKLTSLKAMKKLIILSTILLILLTGAQVRASNVDSKRSTEVERQILSVKPFLFSNAILSGKSHALHSNLTEALQSFKRTGAIQKIFRNISACNYSPNYVAANLDDFPSVKNYLLRNFESELLGYSEKLDGVMLYFDRQCKYKLKA